MENESDGNSNNNGGNNQSPLQLFRSRVAAAQNQITANQYNAIEEGDNQDEEDNDNSA